MTKKKIDREGIIQKANIDGKTVYRIMVPNYRENRPYENILHDTALTPEEATEKLKEWQEKRKEKERRRDERRAAKIKEANKKNKKDEELSKIAENTQNKVNRIYAELGEIKDMTMIYRKVMLFGLLAISLSQLVLILLAVFK